VKVPTAEVLPLNNAPPTRSPWQTDILVERSASKAESASDGRIINGRRLRAARWATSALIGHTAGLGSRGGFGRYHFGPQGLDCGPQMTVND
jgi:hypothetical protein